MLVEYNFYIPKGMDEQDVPAAPAEPTDAPVDAPAPPDAPAGEPATPEPTAELPGGGEPTTPEPAPNAEGNVELDITDLVNSTKDTKDKIEGTNELLNSLIGKFDEFEGKLSSFDQVLSRIDKLEQDFEKRLPTPVEKLEMRSMDSFPYSVKLSDFWKDETEDIEGSEMNKEGDNYTLTPDDVKKDYDASSIKTSFDVQNPDDQQFEG